MAGRGISNTLPAWMDKVGTGKAQHDAIHPTNGSHDGNDQFEDACERSQSSERISRRKCSRSRDRKRSRSRDRRSSRSKDRRSSRSDRSSRRRRSRSRDRRRRRSRSGRSRSFSGSRSVEVYRRRRKKNLFDVRPPGVTDENAAAYAAQAILQQNMQALNGSVGAAASFGAVGSFSNSASSAQTRHARRIYVGGIGDTNEEELRDFWNGVIDTALGKKQDGGAVLSVYINHERRFAFVELSSIELTTACMDLDGIAFKGQPLKIRRPNDYNAALVQTNAGSVPSLNLAALGVVGTTVPDGPGKVFVGGIPYHLSEEQVRELLAAFGPLKAFHLVKEPGSNTSKGYGFCEYQDISVTDKACEGLNGLTLGDKKLTVRRAVTQSEAKNVIGCTGLMNAGVDPALIASQTLAMSALSDPTNILVLLNMVLEEELADEEEYKDIMDDIMEECSNFGLVLSLSIPRPGGEHSSAVGKVFVEYGDSAHAKKAASALHGRMFSGRMVQAQFYDEKMFAMKNLA